MASSGAGKKFEELLLKKQAEASNHKDVKSQPTYTGISVRERAKNIAAQLEDLEVTQVDLPEKSVTTTERDDPTEQTLAIVRDIAKKYKEYLEKTIEHNEVVKYNEKELAYKNSTSLFKLKPTKPSKISYSVYDLHWRLVNNYISTLDSKETSRTNKLNAAHDLKADLDKLSDSKADMHPSTDAKKVTKEAWEEWVTKSKLNIHKVARLFVSGYSNKQSTERTDKDQLESLINKLPARPQAPNPRNR